VNVSNRTKQLTLRDDEFSGMDTAKKLPLEG
jgi:hypothetical protein